MNILILNDSCSHGQVATNSIKPCLEKKGLNVYAVPTCLISSTFNKPSVVINDTTDYLIKCLDIYSNNVIFDYIIIGFVYNEKQASKIIDFIAIQDGATVLVDPTMADNGKMYKSLNDTNLSYIKKLCKSSDIIVPNITEARFLCDDFNSDIDVIKEKLKSKFNSIVITSIEGKKIFVYDKKQSVEDVITYENVEGTFPGTGDLFVGLMLSEYIFNNNICLSSKHASDKISKILKIAKEEIDIYNGIPISKYL